MFSNINSYTPHIRMLNNNGNVINKNSTLSTRSERSCGNMSFRDLVETVEAAQAGQVKKCNLEIEQVGVADLSERNTDYYKTGDYVQDRKIEMGIQYKKSCFDFTNASDFDELTAAEDFTGMSNAEKYKAVYEKYQHCYGDKFLDAFAISYVSPPHPSEDRFREVMQSFFNEVNTVCGGEAEAIEARQEALYGGGSDYEIRQSIIDKYPCAGEMTFRDLYKMTFEMKLAGVGGDVNNWIGELFGSFGYYSNGLIDTEFLREEKLDSAVTLNHLQYLESNYSKRISNGIAIHPEFGAALSQIKVALGM